MISLMGWRDFGAGARDPVSSRSETPAGALSKAPKEKQADEDEVESDVMQVTADPAVQHDKEMELGTEFVKLQRERPTIAGDTRLPAG